MASLVGAVTVDAAKHVGQMTLRVQIRGATRMFLRSRLASYWLKVGAWIIGCQFALDSKGDDD